MEGNVLLVVGGLEGAVLPAFAVVVGVGCEEGAVRDRFVLEGLGWRAVIVLLLLSTWVLVLLELLPWGWW